MFEERQENQDLLLGGIAEVEVESDGNLIMLINIIKELDDSEFEFVMQNTMRLKEMSN